MSESLIKSLDEQRKAALHKAREIAERAAAGEEKAEDEEAYVRANADFDRLTKMMRDEQKRDKDEVEIAEAREAAARSAGNREQGDPEHKPSGWLDALRKSLNDKEQRKSGENVRIPSVQELPEIRARLGVGDLETRATPSTLTTGANTVPVTLEQSLFRKLFDDSAILSAGVRILRTDSGEQIKFPRLTALGALTQANSRVGENATINKDQNPTFDQVVLDAYKYAQIMQTTRELVTDSVIDIEALLGELLGRNMANYLGYDLTLGDGSSKPKGVVPLVPAGQTVTAATGLTAPFTYFTNTIDPLLDVIWKLKPTYRRNGKFLCNDNTLLILRKIKMGGTSGDFNTYAFQPAGRAGEMDTLLGYPIMTDPNISVPAATTTSLVFADMSMYWVRLVADMRVEWSTEYAWDTDLISVKAVLRADGDTIDDTAFAALKGAAT